MAGEVAVAWKIEEQRADFIRGSVAVAEPFNICAVARTKDELAGNKTEVTLKLSAPSGGFDPFEGRQLCECAYSAISPNRPLPKQTVWNFTASSKAINAKPRWVRILITRADGLD